ncbi:DOMON domain-containing protein [Budvicia aquatica]|uniref:Invasin domain-containing protein n=1 Tax=Budvicia aquatica TaxID=82979 RepID=A0A2C6DKY5_9GAMM|nr:hypothetical protein [Budvicia aquatica]PHI28992.1 hypothetical protein CRN84_06510 [Budvicia aquatica]
MLAVLISVILVGSVVPVGAVVLSDPTGIIHGRAPTAVGDLYAVMPDGTTVVTDNVIVSQTATPSQFTVSSVTTGITPYDADGDTGLTMTPDMPSATLVWKQSNGTPLTAAQLAAPLVTNFPGSTVTLEVHAPVTTTSTSGLPTTAGQVPFVTAYTVKVPTAPIPLPASVKFNVNGYQFAGNSGFPSTAYTNASYQIWMNGTSASSNASYTYSSSASWVTVSALGVVVFTAKPPAGQGEATITVSQSSGTTYEYKMKIKLWEGVVNSTPTSYVSACRAIGLKSVGVDKSIGWPGQNAQMTRRTAGLNVSGNFSFAGWEEWGSTVGTTPFASINGQFMFAIANSGADDQEPTKSGNAVYITQGGKVGAVYINLGSQDRYSMRCAVYI